MRATPFVAAATLLVLAAPLASADEPRDVVTPVDAAPPPTIAPHPWLYLDDPTTPGALRVTAFSRATYTGTSGSPTRPFGTDVAHAGGVIEMGGEVGLTDWMSIAASGYGSTLAPADNGQLGMMAGLRFAPFARTWETTHLVLSGGVLRELAGGMGAWGRVSITQEVGRARFGAMVHGERVFLAGRDGVDVMLTGGASYEVAGPLRLGVEYVAQDVEESFDDQAEGGMRHFAGPTASVELLQRRLSVNAGPAIGLSHGSPPVLGRFAMSYAF